MTSEESAETRADRLGPALDSQAGGVETKREPGLAEDEVVSEQARGRVSGRVVNAYVNASPAHAE